MSLRGIAEKDLRFILGDSGWSFTIFDPSENALPVTGLSNDISRLIDPDTGQAVSGRFATISVSYRAFHDAGMEVPRSIPETTSKPWVVQATDVLGKEYRFKIIRSEPDRTLGLILCTLEAYR